MLGWMKHKLESRLMREISTASDMQIIPLMAESKEELKEESKKSWFKTQHSETKIMTYGPNTPCEIDGKTMETVADFMFLGSLITADGDCNHEI